MRDLEIKGGAGEFEAAVVAVVLDRIAREENRTRSAPPEPSPGLSPWMKAILPEEPDSSADDQRSF